MLALAAGLRARGHAVTFVAQADVGPLVRGQGSAFAPVGAGSHPPGTLDGMAARLGATTGLLGIRAVIADVARMTDMLCREAPGCLRAIGATAIIADQTEAAGGLVARHLALPHVSVANALLVNREPGVPPPFTAWPYATTEWAIRRNRGGYRVADWLMAPVRAVIRHHARGWALGPLDAVEDCLSPTLQLSQTTEGFDWPRRDAPPALAHVGPLRGPERGTWPDGCGRPHVFCSLGTLQGGRFSIFRAVAEACLRLDLPLVIAHGGKLAAAQVAALPGAPTVAPFVPQRAVLGRAALAITHGGLNTTLDALAAGVPLLVVPLAFEQGAIAARVARSGAGMAIQARTTAPRVEAAIRRVTAEPSYRARAAVLRDEIARAGGVARAVALIEAASRPQPSR